MLRNIFFYILIIPISLYYMLIMLVVSYTKNTEAWGEKLGPSWQRWVITLAGIKIEADFSAIKEGGHYVFMVNHSSNMDICLTYWLLGRHHRIRYVAKKSLWDIPLFDRSMIGAGHIPIDRSNRRSSMKSVQLAVKKAQSGLCPVIFPEGTRSTDFSKLQEFKIGGIIIALKCGVPVVPIIIEGMGEVLPKGKFFLNNKHIVRIKALEPIDPAAYTLKERDKFKNDLYELMNTEYLKMREQRQ